MAEINAVLVTLFFIAGIFLGYWLRKGAIKDLEASNLNLCETNKKLRTDLDGANTHCADHAKSVNYWRARYEDLVEAVKAKAAESKAKKKATSNK